MKNNVFSLTERRLKASREKKLKELIILEKAFISLTQGLIYFKDHPEAKNVLMVTLEGIASLRGSIEKLDGQK